MKILPAEKWRHDPEALRKLLEARKLSTSAVGSLLDVDERTVRRWLSGPMPYMAWVALLTLSA